MLTGEKGRPHTRQDMRPGNTKEKGRQGSPVCLVSFCVTIGSFLSDWRLCGLNWVSRTNVLYTL